MFLQLFSRGKRVGAVMHKINQNPPAAGGPEEATIAPMDWSMRVATLNYDRDNFQTN